MEYIIKKSDFHIICRTCLLVKKDMFSIKSLEILKLLGSCTGIKIEDSDQLPGLICKDCTEHIQKFFYFKQLYEKSEKILLKVLNEEDNFNEIKTEKNISSITNESLIKEEINEINKDKLFEDWDDNNYNEDNDLSSEEDNKSDDIELYKTKLKSVQFTNKHDANLVQCEICSKKIRKSAVPAHIRRHKQPKKHRCDRCSKAYREPNELAKHRVRVHKIEESVSCTVCDEIFQIQAQLDFHMKRHFKKKSVCDICGKEYFNSAKLKRHKLVHEARKKTIFCLMCDQTFARESSLITHNKNYHSDNPISKKICNVCGKSVLNIKAHTLQRHSTDRPFKCEQCDKCFVIRYQLIKHIKEKHEQIEKKYNALCSTCGKCFKSIAELKVHMMSHTDILSFQCNKCDKKYKTTEGLKCHLRKHTDIRPYVCKVCSKGFYTSQILKTHMRIHTGERPYICQICNRAFTQNCSLKTHMKVHGL